MSGKLEEVYKAGTCSYRESPYSCASVLKVNEEVEAQTDPDTCEAQVVVTSHIWWDSPLSALCKAMRHIFLTLDHTPVPIYLFKSLFSGIPSLTVPPLCFTNSETLGRKMLFFSWHCLQVQGLLPTGLFMPIHSVCFSSFVWDLLVNSVLPACPFLMPQKARLST